MTKGYKPSRKEILNEVGFRVYQDARGLLRRMSNSNPGGEFAYHAAKAGILATILPYIIPTLVRKIRECPEMPKDFRPSRFEIEGIMTGLAGGALIDTAQIVSYLYLATHNHTEALAIPIATNLASELYERFRSARQRLIKEHEA